jgi:hypothetical protein
MLPFQGEILVVYFLTQGVAFGLAYFWLSAKSVKIKLSHKTVYGTERSEGGISL